MSLYDLSAKAIDGREIPLKDYKGKVLLIVNTATDCGFTPQYNALQVLYEKHKDEGFEILDFPCNQFGKQANGSNDEIHEFCTLRYKITFPQFEKIDVNGQDESPIYTYLKESKGGLFNKKIKWNFTKFLLNKNGEVVQRYASVTKPEDIEQDIINLLKQ